MITGRVLAAAALAALAVSSAANAGVIIGAASVSSPAGDFGAPYDLLNIVNQSGLSASYVSGVTDFDTYVAGTTHDSTFSLNSGFTGSDVLPQTFTFTLGGAPTIDGIAFWAVDNPGSVTSFDLYADTDNDFSNGTSALLGSFSALAGVFSGQSFSFSAVSTGFVHLRALDSAGRTDLFPGIGEVAFRSAGAVPEPTTWTMMVLGFGLVGGVVRSRRSVLA